jgi:hypothetical protein
MHPNKDHRNPLEHELTTPPFRELLARLHLPGPAERRFDTWADAVAFMLGDAGEGDKNDLLLTILEAHARDRDPRWRTVLLAMFHPGLLAIHRARRSWDADEDDFWQNVVAVFLEVVCRLDPAKRPQRLVQKLINDTVHRLYDEYRRTWRRARIAESVDPDHLDRIATYALAVDFVLLAEHERHEREIARLRAHLASRTIGEADFLLLVGTRVYGERVVDRARELGISFETAKKRRQRAEAAIQRVESNGE